MWSLLLQVFALHVFAYGFNKTILEASEIPARSTERLACDLDDTPPVTRTNTTDRLSSLRFQIELEGIHGYLVPSSDAHQSEKVGEGDKRRQWLTGFTGSNGFAVVTSGLAAVWLDGRYYIQGDQQLDCNWLMMKSDEPETPTWVNWISEVATPGSVIGADPSLIGADTWLDWERKLTAVNITLKPVQRNLIDDVWINKEQEKTAPLKIHNFKYAGKSWEDKVVDLRSDLQSLGAISMVVTALDEVAWLLNLRGADIPNTPLFKGYIVVTMEKIILFVDIKKVTQEVKDHLKSRGCEEVPAVSMTCVTLREYGDIFDVLNNLKGPTLLSKPWAYTGGASFGIYKHISANQRLLALSPIMNRKAKKNPVEVSGMKKANIKDAAAFIAFISELETGVQNDESWDEMKASQRLLQYKRKQNLFQGPSFTSISAYGGNGAIIHYRPVNETNTRIGTDNLYLLDTGSQYLDGTTDLTRTFHFGSPTDFQKEAYTRVLMGSIDLAMAIFRPGTTDTRLDILARGPLYSVGLNYRHGTGHGIGSYGLVHESPIQVRVYSKEEHKLELGHFFSDEPGVYIEGQFGIRLETVLHVVEKKLQYLDLGFGPFYGFEPVCFVPFEPKLIDLSLLTKAQVDWLNNYNLEIKDKVGNLLIKQGYTSAYEWMFERTANIKWER